MATIPADIVEFLESGVSILVGTRDEGGLPVVARGIGAQVSSDRSSVTIYLHEDWASKALANIGANGEIAVGFSRPLDNFAIQLKGKCTKVVPAAEGDRAVVDRYHSSYGEQLYMVGFPRSLTKRFRMWPATAVSFDIRDMFLQTPGPDAGKRYEGGR